MCQGPDDWMKAQIRHRSVLNFALPLACFGNTSMLVIAVEVVTELADCARCCSLHEQTTLIAMPWHYL